VNRLRSKPTLAGNIVVFPRRLPAMAIAAMLIAALGAVGCGSSSSTTTSTTAITKTEFLAKGNAICAKGNKELNAVGAKLGKSPSQAQVTAAVNSSYVPSIQAQIDGIRALGAPAGDEATVTNMLDLAQADLNKIKGDPTLLVSQNDPFANFAKIAHPYGLTQCAAGS
jgi:hypothetical protein